MTHHTVWSAHMIELAVVVTARLHDHPQPGRDEGMHRHPTSGLPHLDEIEDRSQGSTVPAHLIGDHGTP
jgi:hypothetical protein